MSQPVALIASVKMQESAFKKMLKTPAMINELKSDSFSHI